MKYAIMFSIGFFVVIGVIAFLGDIFLTGKFAEACGAYNKIRKNIFAKLFAGEKIAAAGRVLNLLGNWISRLKFIKIGIIILIAALVAVFFVI